MKIEFIFTGKTSEKWMEDTCNNYLSRIKKYLKAEITIVHTAASGSSADIQKKKESQLILERISDKDLVVLLDEQGEQFTSVEFAGRLTKLINSGKARIAFIVGGAYGADALLKKRADMILSFSKMTFTHQMIRLILVEQVYRAFTILKNEKYHH